MELGGKWRNKKRGGNYDNDDEESLPMYKDKPYRPSRPSKALDYLGIIAITLIVGYVMMYFIGKLRSPHHLQQDTFIPVIHNDGNDIKFYDDKEGDTSSSKKLQVTRINFDLAFKLSRLTADDPFEKVRYPQKHGLLDLSTVKARSYKLCCKVTKTNQPICANKSDGLICALRDNYLIIQIHKATFFSSDKEQQVLSCAFVWHCTK